MKKKNSLVQTKLKKNFFFINDDRIKGVYKTFKNCLFPHIKSKNFCIGVSGGPDSLALAYLSSIYAKEFSCVIKVLIIDHGLRAESYNEAKKTKKILEKIEINSKILRWKGNVPKSNIQSIARKIRYKLLFKECKKLNINNLLLGHHFDDLVENFFIRLFRGSGLKGLSSFNIMTNFEENNFKLIRPLINLKKKDLIYLTNKIFKIFISDPSNFQSKYLRVRIRNYINYLKKDGLNFNKIKLTIKNLQNADQTLEFYYKIAKKKHIRFIDKNTFLISRKLLEEGQEIIFRIVGDLISKVGENYYSPRGKNIINLIEKMKSTQFKRVTLGGCILEKVNDSFLVKKE